MIAPELLADLFATNYRVIRRQADGLTHEDSLRQLPFRGNCLNWIVGHIVATRNRALALLGELPVMDEADAARYATGSEPITRPEQALHLEKILSDLDCSQERLTAALRQATIHDLNSMNGEQTVGEQLAFLHFHEAYHTGQTEQLRQLAGKNDKVI
jgi:hypothetical protein